MVISQPTPVVPLVTLAVAYLLRRFNIQVGANDIKVVVSYPRTAQPPNLQFVFLRSPSRKFPFDPSVASLTDVIGTSVEFPAMSVTSAIPGLKLGPGARIDG